MTRLSVLLLSIALPLTTAAQVQQLPPGTKDPATMTATDPDATALQQAEERMAAQDWAGATILLKPLLQRKSPNARALYDAAFCSDAMNDEPAAILAYRKAIAADPQSVPANVGLGLLLARSGDQPGAIFTLATAVALPGEGDSAARAQAYRALARLRLTTAPDQSRDDLLQALRLTPETPEDIQMGGEIAETLHDDAAAETAYARVNRAAPTDPVAAAEYARVLLRQGKAQAAAAALEPAIAAHPDDAPLLNEKAGILLAQKDFAGAIPLLQQMHTTQPANAAVARLLARAYVAQGDLLKGDALFRQLADASPNDGELLAEWADCLVRLRRYPEAQSLLERALNAQFATPTAKAAAATALAFAASANHSPETVLRAISIRNAIEPLDAIAAFLSASAHDTLHQSREAAGAYRQFLDLAHGSFPDEESQAKDRLQVLSRAK